MESSELAEGLGGVAQLALNCMCSNGVFLEVETCLDCFVELADAVKPHSAPRAG